MRCDITTSLRVKQDPPVRFDEVKELVEIMDNRKWRDWRSELGILSQMDVCRIRYA